MAVYYVAKNGSDLGKGTKDDPFLTINKAASVAALPRRTFVAGPMIRDAIVTSSAVKGSLVNVAPWRSKMPRSFLTLPSSHAARMRPAAIRAPEDPSGEAAIASNRMSLAGCRWRDLSR